MNSFKSFAAALMLLLIVPLAHAIPVRWTLDDVRFDDGTVASGAFTYDASSNSFTDLLIATLGVAPITYTTEDLAGSFFGVGPSGIELIDGYVPDDNIGKSVMNLEFAGFLTDAGGLLDLVTAYPSFQGRCVEPDCSFGSVERQVIRGSLRGTPVEEPAMAALLLLGLGVLASVRRRPVRTAAAIST